jgi:putative salt-induced outer membrane protein
MEKFRQQDVTCQRPASPWVLGLLLALWVGQAQAQLTNESELGMVIVGGNAETQTTNLKHQSMYKQDANQYGFKARYTKAENTVNGEKQLAAQNWATGLRYDRALAEKFGAFVSYDIESDRFAGYLQRDQAGIGLTRTVYDTEEFKWSGEVGYTHLTQDFANSDEVGRVSGAKVATKASGKVKEGITAALTFDYSYFFDDMLKSEQDQGQNYFFNAEPSLAILLNNMFSLKLAYLIKYQNQLPAGVEERTDTTYSTTLVAKF